MRTPSPPMLRRATCRMVWFQSAVGMPSGTGKSAVQTGCGLAVQAPIQSVPAADAGAAKNMAPAKAAKAVDWKRRDRTQAEGMWPLIMSSLISRRPRGPPGGAILCPSPAPINATPGRLVVQRKLAVLPSLKHYNCKEILPLCFTRRAKSAAVAAP